MQRRLRAYAGLWALVGLLSAGIVFLAAAAGPTIREIEDRALREMFAEAPMTIRDITASEPGEMSPAGGEQLRDDVLRMLEPELAEQVGDAWGIEHTRIYRPSAASPGAIASLTGDGMTLSPDEYFPAVSLHHQSDLAQEITMVEGEPPATDVEPDPQERVVEVMTSVSVAEALGLRVGAEYRVLPGELVWEPGAAGAASAPALPVRLTGVFEARDAAAPVWEFDPRLLTPAEIAWPLSPFDVVRLSRATLVTDVDGIGTVFDLGLVADSAGAPDLRPAFDLDTAARIRLDEQRLDASWTAGGQAAVAALLTDPRQRTFVQIDTGLTGLLADFERQASATRAVVAVVAAGLIGTGAGLLVLAARLTLERRRGEISLLRARGASAAGLAGRFVAEAALVVVPAAAAGWLLHTPLPGRPDPDLLPGVGALPVAAAVAALLAVPATVAVDRLVTERRRGAAPASGRGELRRFRLEPARLTAEVLVVLLAGLGVWLLRERGIDQTAMRPSAHPPVIDPYLSAVPILVAVAAGLLALRLYPWPLRLFGAVAARRRGAVGFLGFARAGRAAPVTALPLVVLVLAVGLGGFAGAVYASVSTARDAAAIQAVGADVRVGGEALSDEAASAVADVPGVTAVASLRRDGRVYDHQNSRVQAVVLTVDAPAYQEVLAAIGATQRLPEAVVSARPGTGPVPVLAGTEITEDAGPELTVQIGRNEVAAQVVGGVEELPQLLDGERWILVPRYALPEPIGVDELLIAGADVDADAVLAATGAGAGAAAVTTRTGYRADLDTSEFNRGLTLALTAGTAGAAVGGLFAVGLALLVQGAARGRSLSVLRTMGLSSRQARSLLLVELVPVTLLAVATGAVAGALLPVLLAPSLGLTRFTDGVPIPVGLDVRTATLLAALLGVFVVGGAIAEAAVNRRLGLGQVLRVD